VILLCSAFLDTGSDTPLEFIEYARSGAVEEFSIRTLPEWKELAEKL
jgi:hypothetical protein